MMAAGMAICLAVPGQLMGLFTANPITMKAGSVALRVISLGFLASSVSVICSGALEGLGKGVHSLIISLCRYVVVIIPVAFIVSRFMGSGRSMACVLDHGSGDCGDCVCGVSERREGIVEEIAKEII